MAHTVVIQSVTRVGDAGTAVGTVDGISVTVSFWFSAVTAMPTAFAVQTFLAGLMIANLPPVPVAVNVYNGTIIQ